MPFCLDRWSKTNGIFGTVKSVNSSPVIWFGYAVESVRMQTAMLERIVYLRCIQVILMILMLHLQQPEMYPSNTDAASTTSVVSTFLNRDALCSLVLQQISPMDDDTEDLSCNDELAKVAKCLRDEPRCACVTCVKSGSA